MPVCMAVCSTSDQMPPPPPPGPPRPPPGGPPVSDPSVTGRPSSSRGCRCSAHPERQQKQPRIAMKRDTVHAIQSDPPIWIFDTSTSSCTFVGGVPPCLCPSRGRGGGGLQRVAERSISGGSLLWLPKSSSGGPSPPMPPPIMPPGPPPGIMPDIPPPGPKPPPKPSVMPP